MGRPIAHALLAIGPRLPLAGGLTIEKVSSQLFRSLPLRVTSFSVSCSVAVDALEALGGAGFGSVLVVLDVLAAVVVLPPAMVDDVLPPVVEVVATVVVVVGRGSVKSGTEATCTGATTVFPYGSPTLVGCAVGTVNCHCCASISVSTSGEAALSVSLLKK